MIYRAGRKKGDRGSENLTGVDRSMRGVYGAYKRMRGGQLLTVERDKRKKEKGFGKGLSRRGGTDWEKC